MNAEQARNATKVANIIEAIQERIEFSTSIGEYGIGATLVECGCCESPVDQIVEHFKALDFDVAVVGDTVFISWR